MSVDTLARRQAAPPLEPVTINRTTDAGVVLGAVTLDPNFFGVAVNEPLVHQVVVAQLAARRCRHPEHADPRRGARGLAELYRQKGTGSARQGSIRAPHYAGGGVALGPQAPGLLAAHTAEDDPAGLPLRPFRPGAAGALRLIDRWTMEVPRTKDALAALRALGCSGRVLVVVGRQDEVVERSFRNVPEIVTLPGDQVTAYDLLVADVVVYTDDSLPGEVSAAPVTPSSPAKAGPAKKAAPRKAAAKPAPAAPETDERGDE